MFFGNLQQLSKLHYSLKQWGSCLTVNTTSVAKVSRFTGVLSRCPDIQDKAWSALQTVPPNINVIGIPSILCRSAAHCHNGLLGHLGENSPCFLFQNHGSSIHAVLAHRYVKSMGHDQGVSFLPREGQWCLSPSLNSASTTSFRTCSYLQNAVLEPLLNHFRKIHFWRLIQTLFKLEITSTFHAWGFIIRTTRAPRHK